MNKLTGKQISQNLNIPIRTVYDWLKYLNLPFLKINGCRYYIKNNISNFLFESIKLSHKLNKKPFYTIRELSVIYNKHPNTMYYILKESKIPFREVGKKKKKKVFFLSDLFGYNQKIVE